MPLFGMRPTNLLEVICDEMPIAVLVVDENHRIAYANDPALQIFGIDRTAILTDFSRIEDLARVYSVFDSHGDAIKDSPILRAFSGEDIEPRNVKLGLPDGSFKWLHVSTHHFSVTGLSGVLLVAIDETREVELQRITASIQKSEVLSTLVAGLAHNFRNIIEIINLSVYLCLEHSGVAPEIRVWLQQISDASRHASDLTRSLAEFSRSQELQPKSTQINRVVHDAVALIEPVLFSKINVVTNLHPELPDVQVDIVEMQQVIINLMLNARDAMPQGGQLTVTTDLWDRPCEATIGSDNAQGVTITVSDTGSGIPEEIVEHLFEPFFTTKPKGTGLGLASSQGIVRQHGGDITVQSSVENGTQFTVYLPPGRRNGSAADMLRKAG